MWLKYNKKGIPLSCIISTLATDNIQREETKTKRRQQRANITLCRSRMAPQYVLSIIRLRANISNFRATLSLSILWSLNREPVAANTMRSPSQRECRIIAYTYIGVYRIYAATLIFCLRMQARRRRRKFLIDSHACIIHYTLGLAVVMRCLYL